MSEEEIRQRVRGILSKQNLGHTLTSQEETILAFAYYAAGEQAVKMWDGPEPEVPDKESSLAKAASALLEHSPNRLGTDTSALP